jgi:glucan phosphoethanolaminetransferase (alkaline phosphatase superfamily)
MLTTLQKWLLGVFIGVPATLVYGWFGLLGILFGFDDLQAVITTKRNIFDTELFIFFLPGLGGVCGILALWLLVLTPYKKLQKYKPLSQAMFGLLCIALLGAISLSIWTLSVEISMSKDYLDRLIGTFILAIAPVLLSGFGFYLLYRQTRQINNQSSI